MNSANQPRRVRDHTAGGLCVVVAKLGFNPLSSKGGKQEFPAGPETWMSNGRAPLSHALRVKTLVWHDDRMAEQVSRGPSPWNVALS